MILSYLFTIGDFIYGRDLNPIDSSVTYFKREVTHDLVWGLKQPYEAPSYGEVTRIPLPELMKAIENSEDSLSLNGRVLDVTLSMSEAIEATRILKLYQVTGIRVIPLEKLESTMVNLEDLDSLSAANIRYELIRG